MLLKLAIVLVGCLLFSIVLLDHMLLRIINNLLLKKTNMSSKKLLIKNTFQL